MTTEVCEMRKQDKAIKVAVQLSSAELKALDWWCDRGDCSRAEMLRRALAQLEQDMNR